MSKLIPRTLLLRTFMLLAALMLLSLLTWFAIITHFEREPRAKQMAQMLVSVANLTRAAMISAHPASRRSLLRELSDREGIHVYPAKPFDRIGPAHLPEMLERTAVLVREELGPNTRVALELNGEFALFVSFHIDGDEYWVALPRERLERKLPQQWLGWAAAAGLLALFGAWLIMFRVTRPLKALSRAALEIGRGRSPPPLPEEGPVELATVAHAFNQMNRDLARMDSDRTLILAGISHDLRTPLTRLRMGIEMSGADQTTRDAMTTDVEEIDKTISQFLDFARTDGGEPPEQGSLSDLLQNLAEHYARLGIALDVDIAAGISLTLRPKALRRAVCNLIDNAVHYAGTAEPVGLHLRREGRTAIVEVADRGPGIPPEQMERVKRPFTRLDEARSNSTGAGLGLAIVERIAHSHGGRFELHARDGGGLLTQIILPLK